MHLRPFLVSSVLFLLPVIHAAGIGQVNGANLALEQETNGYDSNVRQLNAANAVTNANGIVNDLTTLTAAVASSLQNGQGTAATNDPGTEQSVVDSFTAFSDALAGYMEDLVSKRNDLVLQRQQISTTLGQLLSNYNNYASFIEGILVGTAYKDEVDDNGADASEKIAFAQDSFE